MTPRILVLLALLPACAYQTAMKRGEAAAAAGQFPKAYEAYTFAHDTKASSDAEAGMAAALAKQLDAAQAASKAGEFEKAFGLLDVAAALDPEAPRVGEVRTELQNALLDALPERTKGDDLHAAYSFAAIAKRLHPHSWVVEDVLVTMRDRVVADARAKQEKQEWPEARAAMALILEYEPEHQSLVSQLDGEIVADWVASLVARASKAERSHPGLSAVLYARAHEVGEDPELLAKARSLYKAAGETAPVAVFVDTEGAGNRHWTVRKEVKAAAEAMPGTQRGSTTAYDLQAKFFANGETCKETQDKEKLTKEYVSGQRQVPNPEYASVSAELDKATAEEEAATKDLERTTKAQAEAKTALDALVKEHAGAENAHTSAASALALTQSQEKSSAEARDGIVKEIDDWKKKGDTGMVEAGEGRLASANAIHDDWAAKLVVDTKKEADAKEALDAVTARRDPQKAKVEDLDKKLAAAKTRADKAKADRSGLATKLGKTPKTLPEDVKATASYDKIEWTMNCDLAATGYFTTKWKSALDKKEKFEGNRTQKDTAQAGNEKAGIPEDKKAYPREQKALVEELTTEQTAQLIKAVDARVAEYFTVTTAAALAEETDVDGATDTLVRLFSGALERLDDPTRAAAIAYVTSHQDLGDYALLDPKNAKAAAPAPAPAPAEGEAAKVDPKAVLQEASKEEPKAEAKEEPKTEPKAEPKPEPKPEPEEEPKKDDDDGFESPWK